MAAGSRFSLQTLPDLNDLSGDERADGATWLHLEAESRGL